MLEIAEVVKTRSTCRRRQVGCVLVDKHFRILSTGYNGNPPGCTHCVDQPCPGANMPSGRGLDLCEATHAEINAVMFCPDVTKVHAIFCTTSPCTQCIKALLTTSAEVIVFGQAYAKEHDRARELWEQQGRKWILGNAI